MRFTYLWLKIASLCFAFNTRQLYIQSFSNQHWRHSNLSISERLHSFFSNLHFTSLIKATLSSPQATCKMYSTPTILITVTVIVLLMATELLGKESPSTTQLTTGSSSKVNKDKFNEAALLEHLLHSYDSRARPVKNISTTIFLDLSMYLVQILKLVSLNF